MENGCAGSGFAGADAAQGIVGARSGRLSGGTPAKPGFLRQSRKKCAQKPNIKANTAVSSVCKRFYRALRHGVKLASGMPARSAFKPAGGVVWIAAGVLEWLTDLIRGMICQKKAFWF
jgi:hypothetical protein